MTTIVFDTPGLIDMRAFTLMGVSAKPNTDNPIGYFGTGIKYAMATLVRLGAEPVVWVGLDKYTFQKYPGDFRGTSYDAMRMKFEGFSLRHKYIQLPYATDYGRNWQAWMALRELVSNTLDEGGSTYSPSYAAGEIHGDKGRTRIVIDLPEFSDAYAKLDEIFLPGADRQGDGIQVLHEPANHLYWRGMRVHDLGKPSLCTYNFLQHMALTEDRTLQGGDYLARYYLGQYITQSNDEEYIEQMVTCKDTAWESDAQYDKSQAPSRAFHNVMLRHPKNVRSQVFGYYGAHDERVTVSTYSLREAHPFPWVVVNNDVRDKNGKVVFDAPYQYAGKWSVAAEAILKLLGAQEVKDD